jgi:hypothetical protein
MKLEELRIGNWVFEELGDEIYEVTISTLDFCSYPLDRKFKPIPLNEEWLIKLGFRFLNGHEFAMWIDEYECVAIFVEKHFIGIRVGLIDVWTTSRNMTVHQLQNFYFSLRGQELTIK